jgi:serine-type D-Ala-D-Ala carboxypeptidase/endopeptidase (penicillin-binding protein 4)
MKIYNVFLRIVVVVLAVLGTGTVALAGDVLAPQLSLPREARWGLVALELKSGRELLRAGNAVAQALVPGSLVKIFTAGAVLERRERVGALNLETTFLHDGEIREGTLQGNLYIVGRGNALLSAADLKGAAAQLAARGIRRIAGDIVADATLFDNSGLERSRKGPGYAPAGALGIDLNTLALTVIPTEPGKPPRVMLEPRNAEARLALEARTVAAALSELKVIRLDDSSYKVSGNIAADSAAQKWRFPLDDAALSAAGALRDELHLLDCTLAGKLRKGKAGEGARLLTSCAGPDLVKLIREMDVNSLNVVADNLLLLLGAESFGAPGTREKGLKAVNGFLDSLELPKGEAALADGSGLREDNRVTAGLVAGYLVRVAQKSWYGDFYDSLPRSGREGTLRQMAYQDPRFRVKSGRLENAFALAGYGVDGKGREIAFAYIVNMPGGAVIDLERSGAEIMRYLGTEVLR